MKDLYKCPSCSATDYAEDLYEESIGDGYVCNNCLEVKMIWQKPEKKVKQMRAYVTVNTKKSNNINFNRPIRMDIQGDPEDLQNLMKELTAIKDCVNGDVNRAGLTLKDVKIKIQLKVDNKP